jgi:hypothetical protein
MRTNDVGGVMGILASNIWLDRTGMILNFIAAFLVAPELIGQMIGLERLIRLEFLIKESLTTKF